MADTAKGLGRLLAGEQFDFTLDGLATAKQMDKLISVISASMGGTGAGGADGAKAALKRGRERLKEFHESIDEAAKASRQAAKAKAQETENSEKANKELYKFKGALHSLGRGSLIGALESIDSYGTRFALGLGTLVGSLTGYADKITEGLQRGVSGGIFDYAIAAKTAGITIEQFSKALGETGGGFASLGIGATDGAKQFGALVGSVRQATEGVGNLGMTNEQIAMFTAQQTKTAISQGFKGKVAQDIVIKNSRALGDELDTLANRTGKSVLELAAAAMKLSQDPIVASFVDSAKRNGAAVSKAAQQFGASLRGIFGEAGDTLASDALKSALGGLPLIVTQTGKNLINASSAVYSELERQAKIVKSGGDLTAADQEKLRDTVLREVEVRGEQLRMLASFEGAAGDGARQILELAKQAKFYNSEEGAKRREEDKTALAFNAQIRAFQANIQKLAIPFLALINTIDWTAFMAVLSGVAWAVGKVLSIFTGLGEVLGSKNIVGTVVGGLFGVASILGLIIGAYSLYTKSLGLATIGLQKFSAMLMKNYGFSAGNIGGTPGKIGGKLAGVAGVAGNVGLGMLGSGAAAAMMGGPQTTTGSVLNMAGGVAGGALLGPLLGRMLGSVLGSLAGPIGAIVAGTAGAAVGQWLGDKMGGASADLATVGAEGVGSQQSIAQAQLYESRRIANAAEKTTSELGVSNYLNQKSLVATNDVAKSTRESLLYTRGT